MSRIFQAGFAVLVVVILMLNPVGACVAGVKALPADPCCPTPSDCPGGDCVCAVGEEMGTAAATDEMEMEGCGLRPAGEVRVEMAPRAVRTVVVKGSSYILLHQLLV